MTFEERMTKILGRAWDEWVKPGDGNQERAARLLYPSLVEAEGTRGWTLQRLHASLARPGVTGRALQDMILYVRDWSPSGQRRIDWADAEAERLFGMVRGQRPDEEVIAAIGDALRRAASSGSKKDVRPR